MVESTHGEIADDLVRMMKRRRMLVNTDVTGIDLGPKKQMVRIKSKHKINIPTQTLCSFINLQ